MGWFAACSSLVLVGLVALVVQILYFSPIQDPILLENSPLSSPIASPIPINNKLQTVIKLGEGLVKDPEDVSVDKDGVLYACSRDGWILRLHRNGSWEHWKNLHSSTMLGTTITTQGDLIVCDADKGLLKIKEDGVTVLVSQVKGSKLSFADDVIEASDGSLYFSVASTKFDFHNWYLDLLEARPHGQLLKYNPITNQTSILMDNLGFANGVALSKDEHYLVICESWKYSCLRHWLKGEKKGKTETFLENLPGAPDNINLAPDGTFWLALLQGSPEGLGFVHSSKILKHVVASFPSLIEVMKGGLYKKAMVANVGGDGQIIRMFDDNEGKVMNVLTSAVEFEDHLYLASLNGNFIGKLPLPKLAAPTN
ncbi:protein STRICTOSIDINE SYNTHASE-LIKE 4-like [Senna tora]|uniref:Protein STRICTOSIDINE SYNTHASE-LIKE 4-like n=1 Tax=Senna tora TaxID=362788 RepID=A0A835CDI3_9FABA|nr:protein STRICTOSIDINE SYNTHASE-LIKE 4-like [Senna tora]